MNKLKPSHFEIKKCTEIRSRIDQYIPGTYVAGVQKILESKSIRVTSNRITNVRNGRAYDLNIMRALEELARPHLSEDLSATRDNLKKSLNLNKV